jgi:hypothetical protein
VICEICGKDSGEKPLCLPCWKATKSDEYTRCLKCGKWKADSKPVCISCWKGATDEEKKGYAEKAAAAEKKAGSSSHPKKSAPPKTTTGTKPDAAKSVSNKTAKVIAAENDKTLCAVCGENSKGNTLCYNCNQRAMNKDISQCKDCGKWKNNDLPRCWDCNEAFIKGKGTDFRQKYVSSPKYRCKDGREVRSKAERFIADFLFDNNIRFRYETMLILGGVEVHPDFYLEDVNLVLEHCGMDKPEYNIKRQKKEQLYTTHKQAFVTTTIEDEHEIQDVLKRKLQVYFPNRPLK